MWGVCIAMQSVEDWGEQLNRRYRASLNASTGEWTDVDTGTIYKTKAAWDRYVLKMQEQARKGLEEFRDPSSDLQNLPGTKPYFSNDQGLSRD